MIGKLTRTIVRTFAFALALCATTSAWAAAPKATAVWEGNFDVPQNGYSITLPSGMTYSKSTTGNIVIGSTAKTGAIIELNEAVDWKVSVLIKYSHLYAVAGKKVSLATVKDSAGNVIGIRSTANNALTTTGFHNGSDTGYSFVSGQRAQTGSGYLLFSYNPNDGTFAYTGRTINSLSGGKNGTLRWGGKYIDKLSIGGPVVSGKTEAWAGVVIEKVALFVGEAYTNENIADYVFPSQTRWHDNDTYAWRATGTDFHTSTLAPVDAFDTVESDTITLNDTVNDASYCWYKFANVTVNQKYYYAAPGCALFYDRTGCTAASDAQFGPLTLGGLYVTSPQTAGDSPVYYSITGDGDRTTELGDPTGKKETYFVFDESFSIKRSGSKTTSTKLYGVVNVSVASGKTFALNAETMNQSHSAVGTALTTAGDTAPVLKMSGAGKLAVSSLDASTGTLDFSGVTATPFIQGNLTVDSSTKYVFPSSLAKNTAYTLCSGTLTAPASVMCDITVGTTVKKNVLLTFSGNKVSYGDLVYAETFADSDANTGVNVPASGETISAATAAAAVFVQADATLGFSGSGSLTIGDGTGPLYIDSAATLTIDLNGVTAPTSENPFVVLVKGQVYGAAHVNFTNVPSDVITSIGEGGTIALLHNSVYTDLLASWKSNEQKVFAWRDATGNAFQSCNVSSVDTDTGAIKGATATTHSYSKHGGFDDENPAGVLYYDNPAYASSTSVNYSHFTLGGLFVTAGGSSLGNASQQLKLGDNRSNSGRTFHYVFAQSFVLGPFNSDSKLYGPVDLTIYEGATVTLSANGLILANDNGMVANLKMSGGGVLKTSGTITAESGSNGITLDYSALDVSRTKPFIQGNLSIHDNVNLVLPAALAANTPYQLCSGTLTVGSTSLQKPITVGSNTFLADLTFDTSAKTVSYCPVRTTTVSGGTTEWSSLTWANGTGSAGWASGASAHITVSAESTISVGSATTVNKLKLLGSANLTITGIDNLTVGSFDLSEYSGSMVVDGLEAGSIKLNISENATLTLKANAVISEVTGAGTLEIAAGRTVTLTSNTALDGIASLTGTGTLILPEGAIPSTSGLTALLSNANWRGTLEVSSITGDVERDFAVWGNSNSNIKMVGVEGKTKTSNVAAERTVAAGVVLDNGDGDFALKFTSILSGNQSTWTKISGSGTIVLEGDDQQVFEIRDSSGFTGSVSQQANAGRLSFVNNKGSGFKAGKGMITVYDDNNTKAYIGSGATWTAGNKGIQILGTLVIKGDATLDSVSDSAKIIIVNNAKLQYDSLGTLTLSNAVQVVQSLDDYLNTSGIGTGTVKIAFGEDATLFDGAKLIDWSAASLAEPPDGTFEFDGDTPAYKEDNGTYYVLTKDATGLFVREAVAVAIKGGVVTYYATVADAIKAAGNDGLGVVIIIKSTTENIVYDKTKVTLARLLTDITTGTIDPGPEYNAVPGTAQSSLGSYPYTYTNKATTYYWTDAGENDSAWSTPGNWAVDAENGPTATREVTSIDSVVLKNGASVNCAATVACAGMTINDNVTLTGANGQDITLGGNITGSGVLTLDNARLKNSLAEAITVASTVEVRFTNDSEIAASQSVGIRFNGPVSISDTIKTWDAVHTVTGTTTLSGNFNKAGGDVGLTLGDVVVSASTTTTIIAGTLAINGAVTVSDGATFTIPASGLTVGNSASFVLSGRSSVLVDNGSGASGRVSTSMTDGARVVSTTAAGVTTYKVVSGTIFSVY